MARVKQYRPSVSRRAAKKYKATTIRTKCNGVVPPGVMVLEKFGKGSLYDLLCFSEEELWLTPGIGRESIRVFRRIVREDLNLNFKPNRQTALFDIHDGGSISVFFFPPPAKKAVVA